MDDLDPLPQHRRTPPSCARRRARPDRVAWTSRRRSPCDGVLGVADAGADVAALSRPFPSALGAAIVLRRRRRTRSPLRRRAGLPWWSRATATWPRTRRADRSSSTTRCRSPPSPQRGAGRRRAGAPRGARRNVASDRRFRYGDPDARLRARRPDRARALPAPALVGHARRVLRRDRELGRRRPSRSPPGRTSRAPSRCTASPRPRSASRPRAAAAARPRRHRRLLRRQGGRLRLRRADGRRLAPLRRAGALDRGPRRAPARLLERHGAADRGRGGASPPDGELLGLRLDLVDDVGAYVRAPEPATLYRMHGCLTGAYGVQDLAVRSRVVVTQPLPDAASTAASAGRSCTSRWSGRWPSPRAASGSTRPSSPAATSCAPLHMPYRAAAGSVYDSGDYERCLDEVLHLAGYDDLRARAGAARATRAGCSASASPASSSRRSRTWATSRWPRRAEERALGLPKSGNAEGVTIAIGPHGGVTRALHDDAAGPGPPHRRGAGRGRRRSASSPADVDVRADADTAAEPVDRLLGQLLQPLRRRGRRAPCTAPPSSSRRRLRADRRADPGGRAGRSRARRRARRACVDDPERVRLAAAARRLRALGPRRPARGASSPGWR